MARKLTLENYLPPAADSWLRCQPASLGLNAARLHHAVEFACQHESNWLYDLSEQKAIAGSEPPPWNEILGPLKPRGGPAGLIIRHGQIVTSWGDIERVDPTFSATKSYIGLCAAVAYRDGLIKNFDDQVSEYNGFKEFSSDHNNAITWRHLLQQTSEWEGTLWSKPDQVDRNRQVGPSADDSQKGQPRQLTDPGGYWEYNDVRVNLAALCLTRLFEASLSDVLRKNIMDPIDASHSWEWHGYRNSYIEIKGRSVQSVSGGAHWGGGLWISSLDHARMGLLISRHGRWGNVEILPEHCLGPLFAPCPLNRNYGFLWWLNSNRSLFAGAGESSVFAYGAGANYVWIDPDYDLVVVVRWIDAGSMNDFTALVMDSIVRP